MRYIFGAAFVFFMVAIVIPAMAVQESVSIGGHTFTADLPEGWIVADNMTVYTTDSEYATNSNAEGWIGSWKGVYTEDAFDYLGFPDAPKDSLHYHMTSTGVAIFVVKIPEALRGQDMNAILTNAAHISLVNQKDYSAYSEKDTTFKGRQAHLTESDNSQWSEGSIAILLDSDTVAVIQPLIAKSVEDFNADSQGSQIYSGMASDVIDAITVT